MSKSARKIVVSLNNRTLTCYEGAKVVKTFWCATGKSTTPTDRGTFEVLRKHEKYNSRTYNNAPMNYACFFSADGKAIHEAFAVGASHLIQLLLPGNWCDEQMVCGSHGCVRLSSFAAKWVFDWCKVGDPVVVS